MRRRPDRQLWLVTLIAACVVIPRAALVCLEHNEAVDDDYHLRRGLLFWTRPAGVNLTMSNPPLGGAIAALPMWVLGCDSTRPVDARTVPPADLAPAGPRPDAEDAATPDARRLRARAGRANVLYGQPLPPHTLLLIIGLWKAALFVPIVPLAFAWLRELHGPAAGSMAAALLLSEPNFAALIHSPSLDVIGVEAVVLACYTAWRYVRAPTTGWLAATAVTTALAMLVKHLAVIVPAVVIVYVAADAWARRRPLGGAGVWRPRVRRAALAVLIWAGALWTFTGLDVSVPYDTGGAAPRPPADALVWRHALADAVDAHLTRPLPAGQYIGSTFHLLGLNSGGHWGYLFGEHRVRGWWYYFPVVATYKVPLGVAFVFALAALSLGWRRPTLGELGLLVPLLAWGAIVLRTQLNIGFRHAMPAYAFALLLAARAAADGVPRWLRAAAWAGVAAAAVHGLSYHPNYHAYLNWPRDRAYLDISDSNVDWGQAVRPVARWLDARPADQADRPVFVRPFGDDVGLIHGWYLGRRATRLDPVSPRPTTGLLVISPVHVVGLYDVGQRYTALARFQPTAVIADTMLVYDMDQLVAGGFRWPEPVKDRSPFTDAPSK